MIYLIKLLIFGHVHKWKIISECRLTDEYDSVGTRYILQCEKCGNIMKVDAI